MGAQIDERFFNAEGDHEMTRRMPMRVIICSAVAAGLPLFLSVAAEPGDKEPISQAQVSRITSLWERGGGKLDELTARIVKIYGSGNLAGLNRGQATTFTFRPDYAPGVKGFAFMVRRWYWLVALLLLAIGAWYLDRTDLASRIWTWIGR